MGKTQKCIDCKKNFNILCDDGRCWFCYKFKWKKLPDTGCYAVGKEKK